MYTYPYILTSRKISKASIDQTFLNRLLHNFYFSWGLDEKKAMEIWDKYQPTRVGHQWWGKHHRSTVLVWFLASGGCDPNSDRLLKYWGQIWSQESVGTVAISPSVGYENPRDWHKNIFETRIVCLKREITISQCEGLESAHQHVHLQIWVLFFIKKPVNTPYSMGVSVVSTKNPLISSRSKSLHLISGLIWWNTGDRNTVGYRWILARNFTKRQGLISSLVSQMFTSAL